MWSSDFFGDIDFQLVQISGLSALYKVVGWPGDCPVGPFQMRGLSLALELFYPGRGGWRTHDGRFKVQSIALKSG